MLIIGIALLPSAYSQINTNSFDSIFNAFKNDIQTEFDQFKAANDSVFVSFLRQSWEEYDLLLSERPPSRPKPKTQPVVTDLEKKAIELIPETKPAINLHPPDKEHFEKTDIDNKNIFDLAKYTTKFEFKFYGTDIDFDAPKDKLQIIKKVSNTDIAKFYEDASKSDFFTALLQQSILYKHILKLNGWAYLKLCNELSKEIYSDNNMQVLALWYLMVNSGHKAKVAYNSDEIYLLCVYDAPIFNVNYIPINNEHYYLYLKDNSTPDFNTLFTYKENHQQQTESVSLSLNQIPEFDLDLSIKNINFMGQKIEAQINNNLINFYTDYPDCALEITLNAPLSDIAFQSLDSFLAKKMKNLDDREKLDFLLDFVQRAFEYKTDEDQFGKENYLFADESLNYPYSDCEDRVALLVQLLKKYTDLIFVGLDFPEHISLAVHLNEEINGAFIDVDNLKYYVCDPTYMGAKCGMIMPVFIGVNPKIINLN